MLRVNVLYHHFPHYRRPVLEALLASNHHQYRFYGGHKDVAGIKVFAGDDSVPVHPITFNADEKTGKLSISNYKSALKDCDALIVIGNPNILATWKIALNARLKGTKVLFWTHGWLKSESWIKSRVRNLYFSLAHRVLVYGERAINLAESAGFPKDKVRVIYNSLDFSQQDEIFNELKKNNLEALRKDLGLATQQPVFLAISRLTEICHYEWLIEAASQLKTRKFLPQLIFIGDGPLKGSLENKAKEHNLDAKFLGAIYDENLLGQYIMASNAVVSPGKVGLTAMHALAFGTPVVTHGNLDMQMPEVEAVIPNISGEYFSFGDVNGLTQALLRILANDQETADRRRMCRDIIVRKYTPEVQAQLINEAIDELF